MVFPAAAEYLFRVTALIEFFQGLLQAQGATYPELVKSTLKNRTTYLLVLNKLNNAERNLQ